jgi:hypothetical protein
MHSILLLDYKLTLPNCTINNKRFVGQKPIQWESRHYEFCPELVTASTEVKHRQSIQLRTVK